MGKFKKVIKRVIIILLSLILIWVFFYTIIFNINTNYYVKPFMELNNNEFIQEDNKNCFRATIQKDIHTTIYRVAYSKYNLLGLQLPKGMIEIFQSQELADDLYHFREDYSFVAYIDTNIFSDYSYSIHIFDLKRTNEEMNDTSVQMYHTTYVVDKKLNIMSDGIEKSWYTEEEIERYNELLPQIKEFWENEVIAFLGIENVYK